MNMFVGQAVLSGITLEQRVDQLVINMDALADSDMMMQLCCHNWDVRNLQQ